MSADRNDLFELVRANLDAFNEGDFDTAVGIAAPDVVHVRPGGLPEVRGAAALRQWMEPDAFESQRYELLTHEVKGNRVLTEIRTTARGVGSGLEMQVETIVVWTFNEEGKVARCQAFLPDQEELARRTFEAD